MGVEQKILRDRDNPLTVGDGTLYLKVISADEIELTSGRYDIEATTWKSWGIDRSFPFRGRLYEVKLHFHRHPDNVWRVGKPGEETLSSFFGDRYFETRDWRCLVPVLRRYVSWTIDRDCRALETAARYALTDWLAQARHLPELVRQADHARVARELDRARSRHQQTLATAEEQAEAVAALERQLAELSQPV